MAVQIEANLPSLFAVVVTAVGEERRGPQFLRRQPVYTCTSKFLLNT